MKIDTFLSHQYREVMEITEWKDGCIWRTVSIGFIHIDDKDKYPPDKYILCSISTRILKQEMCVLEPYITRNQDNERSRKTHRI